MPQADSRATLTARVVSISQEYANINTDVNEEELAALGIVRGTQFTATLGQERISALLGSDYNDVPRGDWVALIERDERDSTRTYLQLAISFGNAATEIGCAVGDTLYIEQP
tara:strand:- start:2640 stop:2975 length:336 start_codon:yes stop_codon:yes gene_type:complete